jgi:hypothetical protein
LAAEIKPGLSKSNLSACTRLAQHGVGAFRMPRLTLSSFREASPHAVEMYVLLDHR